MKRKLETLIKKHLKLDDTQGPTRLRIVKNEFGEKGRPGFIEFDVGPYCWLEQAQVAGIETLRKRLKAERWAVGATDLPERVCIAVNGIRFSKLKL